ncbi:MAG: OmpA family protein, partial [Bacteroidia bacterium]|nr:OmpA family protein [Bacteroidia bacterium]
DKAVNLGQVINTMKDETGPFMHPDKQTLYFRSNGHVGLGAFDIFCTHMKGNNEWYDVINLGYPINSKENESALFVDLKGDYAYFSSNKDSDNQDIYRFKLPDQFKPDIVTYVKFLVKDALTKMPLSSSVQFTNLENGSKELRTTGPGGKLLHTLKKGNYQLTVSHPDYVFHSENILFGNEGYKWKPIIYEIELQKLPGSTETESAYKAIVLNNIFFDSGSFELLPESDQEIQTLYEFLKKNMDISIRILGHTDNIGTAGDNLQLSQERARSVYTALVDKGISPARLSYLGHGEKIPLASNETEEGRQTNRRTEFIIID